MNRLLVLLGVLLAFGLRVAMLDHQSFWNDEGNSARIAERSPRLIVEGAAGDIHPPGYYLLLAGWRAVAGHSEFALRFVSVAASTLAAAVIAALGQRLFSAAAGLLAALLAAVSAFQVYYAQEARMYALLALLATLSLLLTVDVLRHLEKKGIQSARALIAGYVLVNAAGLYTHYSFPFVLAAEAMAFVVWLVGRPLRKGAVWIGLQAAALLLFAPWLPVAVRQVTGWPTGGIDGVPLSRFVLALVYGTTLTPTEAAPGLVALLLAAVVGVFASAHANGTPWTVLVVGGAAVTPVALLALGANTEPFLKFLLPANLILLLLAAHGLVQTWHRGLASQRALAAVLGLFILLPLPQALSNLYDDPLYARADYRGMAARIMAEAGTQAGIVLTAPNQWEVFTYYYPDGPNVAPLPDGSTQTTLTDLTGTYTRIYALFWGEGQQDPDRSVEAQLDQLAFPVRDEWVGDVRFVTYAIPAEPATTPETAIQARFGESIRLEGYALSTRQVAPGEALGVTLFWQTQQPLDTRYKVFVHMLRPDGTILTQHDSEPAGDVRPTTDWAVGETIVDNHGLIVPLDAASGSYRIVVGVYDPADGTRLVLDAGGTTLDAGRVTVP
ncbi:MAG: glycosyltransferase family 39 protein [Anaerolineae bacterium]